MGSALYSRSNNLSVSLGHFIMLLNTTLYLDSSCLSMMVSWNRETVREALKNRVGGGEGLSCNRLNMYSSILSRG